MKNFTQTPNFIINNKGIPDGAFRTYMLLKSYKYGSSKVFPSQSTLANTRGKTKKTIINHLKVLRAKGLIIYKKRGFSASNQYEFISGENYTIGTNGGEKKYPSKVKQTSPLSLQKLQSNNTKLNNTEINNKNENKKNRGLERIKIEEIRKRYSFLKKR